MLNMKFYSKHPFRWVEVIVTGLKNVYEKLKKLQV
jgi:hypothetical protein